MKDDCAASGVRHVNSGRVSVNFVVSSVVDAQGLEAERLKLKSSRTRLRQLERLNARKGRVHGSQQLLRRPVVDNPHSFGAKSFAEVPVGPVPGKQN